MQYFTETAYTHTEALHNIKEKYGDRAKVLTHRSIRASMEAVNPAMDSLAWLTISPAFFIS